MVVEKSVLTLLDKGIFTGYQKGIHIPFIMEGWTAWIIEYEVKPYAQNYIYTNCVGELKPNFLISRRHKKIVFKYETCF